MGSRPFVLLTARHAILFLFVFFLFVLSFWFPPLLPLITRCFFYLPSATVVSFQILDIGIVYNVYSCPICGEAVSPAVLHFSSYYCLDGVSCGLSDQLILLYWAKGCAYSLFSYSHSLLYSWVTLVRSMVRRL
ncbi:MAG: hypothetical protein JOS17DRAFT_744582 [Linnemannia elongata]|nr:MAG: hypothetical protein JOS17DRAFT_744582 [Linnemannia elongata]